MARPPRRRATAHRPRARQEGAEPPRRGGGLRRIPDLLTRVLDPAARRRGLAEAKLLTEWPAIVGTELAARCQPVRLGRSTERHGGVLVLHTAGTAALELQHSELQILERINGFFGYPAVSRLRLVQAPPLERGVRPANPVPRRLSEAEEIEVVAAVQVIRDPGLKAALADLGRALRLGPREASGTGAVGAGGRSTSVKANVRKLAQTCPEGRPDLS